MRKKLGEKLIESGVVTAEAVGLALQHQRATGHRLGDSLVELGLVEESALLRVLAAEFGTRFVAAKKLSKVKIDPEVLDRVPVRMAESHVFMPIALNLKRSILSVVMAEPQNKMLISEIAGVAGVKDVESFIGLRGGIVAAVRKHYYGDPSAFAQLEAMTPSPRAQHRESAPGDPSHRTPQSGMRPSTPVANGAQAARTSPWESTELLESLRIIIDVAEARHPHLAHHSVRLAREGLKVASRSGLSWLELKELTGAAYLHNLSLRSRRHHTLANDALDEARRSESLAAIQDPVRLFERARLPPAVGTILGQLHEAFDGTGVPHGLSRDDILPAARILAALDSYFDLTANPDNAIGRLLPKEEALSHLREHAGTLYDPRVIDIFDLLQGGSTLEHSLVHDGRCVLIAVPDPALRQELVEGLFRAGIPGRAITAAEDASDEIRRGEVDVLVLGRMMGTPRLQVLADDLRAQPETADVPIAVVGATEDGMNLDGLRKRSVAAFIPSPLDLPRTVVAIAALFEPRTSSVGRGRPVEGSLEEMPMRELLSLLSSKKKSGTLAFNDGSQDGRLELRDGRALSASFNQQNGIPAIRSLLALNQADFVYQPGAARVEKPEIDEPLEDILRSSDRLSGTR